MSEKITPRSTEILADITKDFNRLTLEGKLSNEQSALYEQLILNMVNPSQEWGRNNLRDLIVLFHESGQSADQIYNILYTMGVEKQTAYDGIKQYLPKKNKDIKMSTISIVSIKEQLGISSKIQSLIEKLQSLNTGDTLNYTVKSIIGICESYLQNDISGLSAFDHSQVARGIVRELNQYGHIKQVAEAIKSIEDSLVENSMGIELDGLYNKLSNQSTSINYVNVIGKVEQLKDLNESEIREKSKAELINFNYIELSDD
jgi:hypothetical protein